MLAQFCSPLYGPVSMMSSRIFLRALGQWRRVSLCSKQQSHRHERGRHSRGERSQSYWFNGKCAFAFTTAATFSFQENGISDERLNRGTQVEFDCCDNLSDGWEHLYEEKEKNLRVYRRVVKGMKHECYQYRVAGSFYDITPRNYIDAQNDVNYRSEWDTNVISLDVIEEDADQQLIRWVAKYPYPMYPREYVYVRRSYVSQDNKIVVIESEVVGEKMFPCQDKKNVRVETYTSQLAVRAHSDLDSQGLDYVLTYFDNPEANIPTYVYNWIVNQGGPYFVKQVHLAAQELEHSGRKVKSFFNVHPSSVVEKVNEAKCTHSCPIHCREAIKTKPPPSAPKVVLEEKPSRANSYAQAEPCEKVETNDKGPCGPGSAVPVFEKPLEVIQSVVAKLIPSVGDEDVTNTAKPEVKKSSEDSPPKDDSPVAPVVSDPSDNQSLLY